MDKLKIGFFASHNGSNIEAILDNIKKGYVEAEPKVIITNNLGAGVLKIAELYDIPSHILNQKHFAPFNSLDEAILQTLSDHDVNFVILAGYMKKLSDRVLEKFPKRALNIHPFLLPRYGGEGMYGENVHRAVLLSDDDETGATVHIVTSEYDDGPILAQCKIPRYKNDTFETLSQRVLMFEHVLYSQVLRDIVKGVIDLDSF